MCNSVENVNSLFRSFTSKNFIVACINARSCANLETFDDIKQFISDCERNIDFLIIGETWFRANECNLYDIQGYSVVHGCRPTRRGGGLSIYIRSNWKIKSSIIGEDSKS